MQYQPHDYQTYATNFIKNNPISAVLLDMGLGKTVITLTALNDLLFDSFEVHKVLIIAPLRVARDTWPQEIRKWDHLNNLIYSVAVGSAEERKVALSKKADIYIINRENVQWLIEESDIRFDFDMVVIDELSSFKNGRSKRFQSMLKVRPLIDRITGLTGTPAGNGLMDLWAEFRLLDFGKRLGRFITQYRNAFFVPDKRNGMVIFSYKPLPGAEEEIYRRLSDITISMKSKDYLKMPDLINSEYKVYLSEEERKSYENLEREFVIDITDEQVTASNAAVLSNKLCQLANGAVYTDDLKTIYFHERKLDALEDIIESANGKPILVAYWFKHDLKRIEERLIKLGINYARLDSSKSIDKWNKGLIDVGLIHPASAGHGLNLQSGGSTIVWYSLTWSLELYLQTISRLWRQGQSSNTVVVQHIITANTIDEDIVRALIKKENIQTSLINAVKANIKGGRFK
ncbi:MAG TPA: DEAD/DEAH box helicase [Acholeplasmataceae bacterium]|nr:DEAD/DEAH box helicase [Acholeplasmataceae bacterium]